MNLEDRNLQIKKLKKESRKLKLLGVEGLFLSSKQKQKVLDLLKPENISYSDNFRTQVLFVGEYLSDFQEDSALLFRKILQAMNLAEDTFAIYDIASFRSPNKSKNKIEKSDEYHKLLVEKIHEFKPKVTVCFGALSSHILLKSTENVSTLRNKFYSKFKTKIICTYHPASLLKNTSNKKYVWEDMKLVMKECEVE